ncbi:phosphodiester glycosidase family protein [Paenibacillus tarimensis]|uniref:phosphodiester glycosidase family protein n=1 Tax=Paenibacillus tarimensis TaxID=416012 RepID=UPI001F24AA75|nr:phosphodiester glycosidase family protein [Paenibacillus tarimensis]MCF2945467.1 phosphodiester glycosidase family protein [Paenibacillus tarimensis]
MKTIIIGIDCSTNPRNVGYSVYDYTNRVFIGSMSGQANVSDRLREMVLMPTNYNYLKTTTGFHVIITPASNIVNKNLRNKLTTNATDYGVNGGFFYPVSTVNAPTEGLSIAITPGDTNDREVNGGSKRLSRGTAIVYRDPSDGNKYKMAITRAVDVADIKKQFGTSITYQLMFGGGSLSLRKTESVWLDELQNIEKFDLNATLRQNDSTGRTGLGFRVIDGVWKAYLVFHESATLKELRNFMKDMCECYEAIILDGGGSSGIQVKEDNGNLIKVDMEPFQLRRS